VKEEGITLKRYCKKGDSGSNTAVLLRKSMCTFYNHG